MLKLRHRNSPLGCHCFTTGNISISGGRSRANGAASDDLFPLQVSVYQLITSPARTLTQNSRQRLASMAPYAVKWLVVHCSMLAFWLSANWLMPLRIEVCFLRVVDHAVGVAVRIQLLSPPLVSDLYITWER